MPTSKKRGGQKKHNQRIASRNQAMKAKDAALQKLFNESMKQQIEEMKKKAEEELAKQNKTEE